MTLPRIEHPIHSIKVPSTKKLHNFRPFLVKEEKILLMAKEGEDSEDMINSVKQIVNNCCMDANFNVHELTTTDLCYLFIRLRCLSVDSKVKQSYRDIEDEKIYEFEIDLNKVQIKQDKTVDNNIRLSKTLGIILKYPTAHTFDATEEGEYGLIPKCIDKIYDGDEIFDPKTYPQKELVAWIDDLSVQHLEKINEFMANAPRLEYIINYKNSLGNDRKIILTSLNDFFSWG